MNNTGKKKNVVIGAIKKAEIPLTAAKYNIGDKFRKKTIDGESVTGTIVGKTKEFCVVQTVGKKECFLWKDLVGKK